jgi:CubicO group peptidase (beta-lactamase class C family)
MHRFLTRKNLIRLLAILLAAISFTMLAWVLVAGPVTVQRILRYGDTNIGDFEHYPSRRLQASSSPFIFKAGEGAARVPEEVTLDGGVRASLEDLLTSNDTIAFLIIKGDTLLFERYYQGHTPSSLSQSFSVSKSFTSALVGAAIQDGILDSVDQPVTDYVPELSQNGFGRVTIRHLLTMMSGSDYVENDNPFGIHVILNYTPHLEAEILDFGMEGEPGEVWSYKSGDNALLALILQRALGQMTVTEYMQAALWEPLGMQYDGLWSLDRQGGLEKTWCCLAAAARDFARLGRLYLQDGALDGEQVLSPGWVRQSVQVGAVPESAWPADFKAAGLWNYGYQWWLVSKEEGDYLALGKDGQYLYVNPAADLVLLRLGWSSGELSLGRWIALFKFLSREIR